MAADDRVTDLVPFVHVADMERSLRFYELLGFERTNDHHHAGRLVWVWLERESARIMLALSGAPIVAGEQAVLFYLYTDDLARLRERLLAAGVAAAEIVDGTPGPKRELRVSDPDGYCLMIAESKGQRVFAPGTAQARARDAST
jgi:catechol 2,3-dioxygenase-like lactoylglutathione lyase family enzyme